MAKKPNVDRILRTLYWAGKNDEHMDEAVGKARADLADALEELLQPYEWVQSEHGPLVHTLKTRNRHLRFRLKNTEDELRQRIRAELVATKWALGHISLNGRALLLVRELRGLGAPENFDEAGIEAADPAIREDVERLGVAGVDDDLLDNETD